MVGTLLVATIAVARPITGPWPTAFPAKELCSNCGLCRSAVGVPSVTTACAFIGDGMARAEALEASIHGRSRRIDESLDEAHFGVHETIVLARGFLNNAQWTGVATGVALAWIESGEVDAVVVVAGSDADGFGAPVPVLCRTPAEVLQGRRVKPSLCPSLEVLDEIAADKSIRRLLFCGVGCAVQALRSLDGASPEAALGLEADGLFVLGTHCVDNSPTPVASQAFVSKLPGVGTARANDVLAYEFMADFRVHARLRSEGERGRSGSGSGVDADVGDGGDGGCGSGGESSGGAVSLEADAPASEEVVKAAFMTLPPSIGIPSIAPSCFACFDYTNGLADLVVGYMGAPFEAERDEMVSAPLMVTVRNRKGRRMLARAVAAGRVQVIREGGHGGRALPSSGDRRPITMKTARADSMVQSLTKPGYVAGDRGAPPWIGNVLASLIARTLPKGLEFARYSIDYHYLRNALYCEARMGEARAASHIPQYAKDLMSGYDDEMADLRRALSSTTAGRAGGAAAGDSPNDHNGADGTAGRGGAGTKNADVWYVFLRECLLLL